MTNIFYDELGPYEDNGEVAWGLLELDEEKEPSCHGHGTLEILEVIKLLESNNITCCITGNSALIYYGAAINPGVCSIESSMPSASMLTSYRYRPGRFACPRNN
jgi:hypothetical protein